MAAVAPLADQAADMMQKLTLDTQPNSIEIPTPSKKQSVDSNNMANGVQSAATTLISDITDKAVSYQPNGFTPAALYYGGYDGSERDLAKFPGHEGGVEMGAGAYGENAPLLYHHSYGYSQYPPYSPAVSPVPTLPHDAQLYGAQQYHYPSPYFQSMAPNNGPYNTNPVAVTKGEMTSSAPSDQSSLPVDSANSKSNGIANNGGPKPNNGAVLSRPTYLNTYNMSGSYGPGSFTGAIPGSSYQDPRFTFDGVHSPVPWMDNSYYSDGQRRLVTSSSTTNLNRVPPYRNQSFQPQMGLHQSKPLSGLNSASSGYMNRIYPNKFYGQYGNTYGSGLGYGCYDYASRINGRGWMAVDSKYKPRGRGNGIYLYGTENMDCLNELNRGPRTRNSKNTKSITPVAMVVKGQSIRLSGTTENEKSTTATPDREQYNRQDFPEQYTDAKFFVIKSYSEDDVHKSIKYNIWASTDNGNKKLDAAYQEAEQKDGGCPVFLFFSVNTSGQFVGVAEMIGPVDFNKSVEYWQQDKWIGCFPVKWHIVKDVPNGLLKHIILENNENKPVTNSRDTQEVKLEQGLKMLKIFKDHPSKQCVLDDFDFYEERQKKIQEKKVKQRQLLKQDQTWEGTTTAENDTACDQLPPEANADNNNNNKAAANSSTSISAGTMKQVANGY